MEENFNAGHSYAVPKPGILSRDIATKYKMVELVPASSVFVFPHDLEEIKKVRNMAIAGTVSSGCRMAKLLMNKFWRKNELIGATISTEGCPSKIVLDQHIVRAIKAYCVSNFEATPGNIRQAMASKITSIDAKEKRPPVKRSSEV
ncbi:uncharacterized protein [Argopecten irradians]|uniref:uncharacterized protein n=1 Tax=Argopecten irradians TaxID=31199 RepID=UPI0037156805